MKGVSVVLSFAFCGLAGCTSVAREDTDPYVEPRRPITVSTDDAGVPCNVRAIVQENRSNTGAEIPVYAGPDKGAEITDRLLTGRGAILCEYAYEGTWSGIIYRRTAGAPSNYADLVVECDLLIGARTSEVYSGPCKSGWIESRMLEVAPE